MTEKTTYGEFLEYWLNVYKKPYIRESSVYRIKTVLRKHVPQELKNKRLDELKAFDFDVALSKCEYERTRKYLYFVFTNSIRKAYRLDLVKNDLSAKIELVRHRQKKGKALSKTEQEDFLKVIEKSRYRNLFEFYIYTGCRRSEALGLRWKDVDYKLKTIYVHGTKTESSDREIFLLPEIEEILERQRRQTGDGERIFPYDKNNVSHYFKKYCPNHKLHDLRHTFVTRCAESGININVAQRLAGHSDINTTLQIYTHVTTDFQRSEFNKFKI